MRTRVRHHRGSLLSQVEMALFLVVLGVTRGEQGSAMGGVVAEPGVSGGFEDGRVGAELVVGVDLVQRILVAHELVLREVHRVFLLHELLQLLRLEVLRPAARVVPVVALKIVLHFLVDEDAFGALGSAELVTVARFVARPQVPHVKVGLGHLLLFCLYIELLVRWLPSELEVSFCVRDSLGS